MDVWHVMTYHGAAAGRVEAIFSTAGIFSSQEAAERACIGRRNYSIVGPVPLDKPFRYRFESCEDAGMVGYWPEVDGFRVIDPAVAAALRHPDDAGMTADETPWPHEVTADLIAKAPSLFAEFDRIHGSAGV